MEFCVHVSWESVLFVTNWKTSSASRQRPPSIGPPVLPEGEFVLSAAMNSLSAQQAGSRLHPTLPLRLLSKLSRVGDAIPDAILPEPDIDILNRCVGVQLFDLCDDPFTLTRHVGAEGGRFSRVEISPRMSFRPITENWPWVSDVFEHEHYLSRFLAFAYRAKGAPRILLLENSRHRRGRELALIGAQWFLGHGAASQRPVGDCQIVDLEDESSLDLKKVLRDWIPFFLRSPGVRMLFLATNFEAHRWLLRRLDGFSALVRISNAAAFQSDGLTRPWLCLKQGLEGIVRTILSRSADVCLEVRGGRFVFAGIACSTQREFENELVHRFCVYRLFNSETAEPRRLKRLPRGVASALFHNDLLRESLNRKGCGE